MAKASPTSLFASKECLALLRERAVSRRWFRWGMGTGVLVLGCLLAYGYELVPRCERPSDEGLAVPASHLELGEFSHQSRAIRTIPVTNTGNSPIHVARFVSSCSCLSVRPRSCTLLPGERIELELHFDLAHLTLRNCGQGRKCTEYHFRVYPLVEGWVISPRGWGFRAKVWPAAPGNLVNTSVLMHAALLTNALPYAASLPPKLAG
jgi:hypothetical protein